MDFLLMNQLMMKLYFEKKVLFRHQLVLFFPILLILHYHHQQYSMNEQHLQEYKFHPNLNQLLNLFHQQLQVLFLMLLVNILHVFHANEEVL